MNLLFIVGFVTVNTVTFATAQRVEDVNRYVELIEYEMEKSRHYRAPQDASEYRPSDNNIQDISTDFDVDYIVVGAGAAGAVVASRLSKNPENSVLLLEAGGNETAFTDIPSLAFYLYNSDFNWNFFTTPQNNMCLGMRNRQCTYPRGKGLGGSGITNTLNYLRGAPEDYDSWAAAGNPGWSWNDVFPLFLKSENANFYRNWSLVNREYHKSGGPLTVEHQFPEDAQYGAYINANIELGMDVIDCNEKQKVGVCKTQFTTYQGKRVSTNKAFLTPVKNRPNLKLLTRSYVIKVNIDVNTKRATGVTFSKGNKLFSVRAKQEVIISAGTLQTPQILMLSGIGNANDLREHGIQVIQDLQVGYNLQDHNGYLGLLFESDVVQEAHGLRQDVTEYMMDYGPLTIPANAKGVTWFNSQYGSNSNQPDIETLIITSNNIGETTQSFYNYDDVTYNAIFQNVNASRSFTIPVLLMHPRSRGTVKLRSADPYAFPLLNPNFFSDARNEDINMMYEGIQKVLTFLNTNAFKNIGARLLPATHPSCARYQMNTRDYWFCQLRQLTFPFYHPVGTCQMGPYPSQGAVVNHELKVHGIANLRVADNSIMPTQMTGHTYAPAIMIGEKAAEMILESRKTNSNGRSVNRPGDGANPPYWQGRPIATNNANYQSNQQRRTYNNGYRRGRY